MSVRVYVEGGGNNKDSLIRFREGFASYCGRLTPLKRSARVIPCGGRGQAFDRFCTALRASEPGEVCILLVDSEGPVTEANAEKHLQARDGWQFPALGPHRVFLMVQAMEAWFLADREALAAFYDGGFQPSALPSSTAIEVIPKANLD